uniref:WGS project CAEQ00000000 data, annotated contig 1776 n=1 Tax=Trypanosoma congolense (strain IL3000) TaxID=1068625 RepID=F9W8T5_TRYCI|nr:unnamed protein product [Trypanosoma congolense IL3000]
MSSRDTGGLPKYRGRIVKPANQQSLKSSKRTSVESVDKFEGVTWQPMTSFERAEKNTVTAVREARDVRSSSHPTENYPPSPSRLLCIRRVSALPYSSSSYVHNAITTASLSHPSRPNLPRNETSAFLKERRTSKSSLPLSVAWASEVPTHIVANDLRHSVERRREDEVEDVCYLRFEQEEDVERQQLIIDEMEEFSECIQKMLLHRIIQTSNYKERIAAEEKMWLALQDVNDVMEKEEERRNFIVTKEIIDRRILKSRYEDNEEMEEEEQEIQHNISGEEWIHYTYPLALEKTRMEEGTWLQRYIP